MKIRHLFPLLALTGGVAHAGVQYTITDLGSLGGTDSSAQAINTSGDIAGYAYTASLVQHAAVYSNGTWTDLSNLATGWSSVTYASGLNDDGQVVGFGHHTGNPIHAFLDSAGTFTDLGTLGGSTSTANAINSEGNVVGNSDISGNTENHAFFWTATGGMVDLGTLGGNYSQANAINDSGTVVGASPDTTSYIRAFRWTSTGGIVDLGTLGGASAQANAINASGQIVGSSFPTGSTFQHAALYSAGNWTDLGTLGGKTSSAAGINSTGTIVGSSDAPNGSTHAFVYAGGMMSDLNQLIPSNSGWTLVNAFAVNTAGQIVGEGVSPANANHGYLLTPIPPSPIEVVPVPTIKILGKRKVVTTSEVRTIKGVASGQVTSVTYQIGRQKHWKSASGTAKWKLKMKLRPGKNRLTVIAHGPGGDSRPVRLTVIRS